MKSPRGTQRTTEDTEITEQIPGCAALSVSVIFGSSMVHNSVYPGDFAADRIIPRAPTSGIAHAFLVHDSPSSLAFRKCSRPLI